MRDTRPLLLQTDFPSLRRQSIETLQVNLGYVCNQSCAHCHVNAGPHRTESMSGETADAVIEVLDAVRPGTLDLTGGAPELNPHFRRLVSAARRRGVEVIDRCNLTILLQPGQEGLAEFLAEEGVVVTASLPCYLHENVDRQRGKGVYDESIRALQLLNELGYGKGGGDGGAGDKRGNESGVKDGAGEGGGGRESSGLQLNLVYNPQGPALPPPQPELEADYKRELGARFGIVFDNLFTLANMPISRFGAVLLANGEYESYMRLLRESFSAANLETVMCRSLISADWQGYLYDCDFNQMLALPILASDRRRHLRDLLRDDSLSAAPIRIGEHCYGCTAGQGSSCGGALVG